MTAKSTAPLVLSVSNIFLSAIYEYSKNPKIYRFTQIGDLKEPSKPLDNLAVTSYGRCFNIIENALRNASMPIENVSTNNKKLIFK